MSPPTQLTPYRDSLALATDLYQLTMAQAAFRSGRADLEGVFHLFYRRAPFGGHGVIACGIEPALELVERARPSEADLEYLRTLTSPGGARLFDDSFLGAIESGLDRISVSAMREGELVLPGAPILRVEGPLWAGQLLETPLLTIVGFQSLIATKAARIKAAAGDDPVLEFGLRRAQGLDGALSASRAACVGGADATSNVWAGQRFGIPVRGTHAHSWVVSFDDEESAFDAYAEAYPDNALFLVDTYDTLDGVRRAVKVGLRLRARGAELAGVRLDSGDLKALSIGARAILDEAGFPGARIVASNDLDEHRIRALKAEGARIDTWGVGTRLATAHDQPALGAVYKLGATRAPGGDWVPRIKRSETPVKISDPGRLSALRFMHGDTLEGDMIVEASETDARVGRTRGGDTARYEGDPTPLLTTAIEAGSRIRPADTLDDARARAARARAHLDGEPRFAVLSNALWETRQRLLEESIR